MEPIDPKEATSFLLFLAKVKKALKKQKPEYMTIYKSVKDKLSDTLSQIEQDAETLPALSLEKQEIEFSSALLDSFLKKQTEKDNPFFIELTSFHQKLSHLNPTPTV